MRTTPVFVQRFLNNIIGIASDESEEILKRCENIKRDKLEAVKAQLETEYAKTVKSSAHATRSKYRKTVSEKAVEYKRALYSHRVELIDTLLNDTINSVRDYTSTQAYRNRLAALCAEAAKVMDGRSFSIFLRPEDMRFCEELKTAVPGADFAAGDFRLGGIKALSSDGRINIDETFDSAAENLRSGFSGYFSFTPSD